MFAAPPTTPVSIKVAGLPARVPDVALSVYVPRLAPKVRKVKANPWEFVKTCVADNNPAPPVSAKVTLIPGTGTLAASVTNTVRAPDNCCPAVPVWPLPLTITRFAALPGPAATPVAENVTGLPDRPAEAAVTVFAPALDPSVKVVEASP